MYREMIFFLWSCIHLLAKGGFQELSLSFLDLDCEFFE